ncbi:MAG: gluconokinase [Pseudomonadota bacterium]
MCKESALSDMRQSVIIMGVCGTGKTTVGKALAQQLGCQFLEGDSFHPKDNVEKMRTGQPLDDEDRWPWLDHLGEAIATVGDNDAGAVASCSALKRAYRDRLRHHTGNHTLFVLLHGERDLLEQRLLERAHHYMPASLLDSQLAILELPAADERSLSLDVAATPCDLVRRIENELTSNNR